MPNWYDNSQFIVNATGILAESVSLSLKNSIEDAKAIGNYGAIQTPKGPVLGNITCDYYLEVGNEPNYQTIQGLKESIFNDYPPLQLEICGITGAAYINRYTIRVSPNNITRASVSYVSYDQWSGINNTAVTGVFDQTRTSGLNHFWSTYLVPSESTDIIFSDFEYDCSIDWSPIFVLGGKTPFQMQLNGMREQMSITRNIFKTVTFDGEDASDYYDGITGIALSGLEAIYGTPTSGLVFNVSGVPVINSDMSLANRNYITVRSSIQKFYQ